MGSTIGGGQDQREHLGASGKGNQEFTMDRFAKKVERRWERWAC